MPSSKDQTELVRDGEHMRIAIDARPLAWGPQGGIVRFGRNLITSLMEEFAEHEFVLYCTNSAATDLFPGLECHKISGGDLWFSTIALPRTVRRDNCDALISLSTEVLRRTIPTVLIVYDLYPLTYPNWMPTRFKMTKNYWRQIMQARLRIILIKKLDAVVAISEYTATAVRNNVRPTSTKISVAYPATDRVFCDAMRTVGHDTETLDRLGVRGHYFLYVGAINFQKNVRTLLNAFHALRAMHSGSVSLVIVGHANWPVDDLGLENQVDVIHFDFLDDTELAILYTGAVAFVYLSLDEGFGLPVLEAMTTGAPVIVSDRGALPEVVGEAGIVVDPTDVEQVRSAMLELLINPEERQRQSELSRQRANSFSWSRSARHLVTLINEITSK